MQPERRAAVVGKPIAHSLSPVVHRAAYAALGLQGWHYDAIECDEHGLPDLVRSLAGPEWVGLSLTMPLKRVVLEIADSASPLAREVGAANTLVFGSSGSVADNTDVAGLVGALRAAGVDTVERGLVLGAGGTAQAALAALRALGERSPVVVVRDVARTHDLSATAERLGVRPTIRAGLPDLGGPLSGVVISTLPPGAADAVPVPAVAAGCVVLDVVYAPWPTPFAAAAARGGARTVSGLEMLLHQAAAQVTLMTGRPPPVAAMRTALEEAVAARTRTGAAGG